MRKIALLTATLVVSFYTNAGSENVATAQAPFLTNSVVTSTSSVCPQCGKIHGSSVTPSSPLISGIQPTSYEAPVAPSSSLRAGGGIRNVLSALNAQRSRQGIGTLRYDASLQAVAERRAQTMASMSLKSHPPGSFAPGTYEGVGWSSSYSPSGVSACFTSDTRMQYAGAAMATGRDGVYFAVVYR